MSFWWRAKYANGSELMQFPEGGGENKYRDIDRERLESFEVWDGDHLRLVCHPRPGGSLIYRRRSTIRVIGGVEKHSSIILVGWRRDEGKRQEKAVAAIFPEGHIEMASEFKAGHEFFYAPVPHPEEGEEIREYEILSGEDNSEA